MKEALELEDPAAATVRHDALAALRIRNYRLLAAGWLPASIGLQMQGTALAWAVGERTHDPLALCTVGVRRALPTIALAFSSLAWSGGLLASGSLGL